MCVYVRSHLIVLRLPSMPHKASSLHHLTAINLSSARMCVCAHAVCDNGAIFVCVFGYIYLYVLQSMYSCMCVHAWLHTVLV